MRLQLPALAPDATYNLQVRANEGGAISEWSQLFTIHLSSDTLAPKPPTGLSWVVEGTAFVGSWIAPTQNTDNSGLADLKDYQITLFSPALTSEKVIYYTTALRFDFPYEVNSNSFTVPRAQVTIEVRARDVNGNMSTAATATVSNPAPSNVAGLVVTGGQGTINSVWTNVSDTDLKYYEVYASMTSGFTPGPTNLFAQTPSNAFSFNALPGETWYVKIRAVDIFGTGSVSYASGSATAHAVTDGNPPSSSPTPTVIGSIKSLYVRWTGVTNNDPIKYDVYISATSGFTPGPTNLIGTTGSTFITIQALPGPAPSPGDPDTRTLLYDTDYFVKIIARDDDGSAAAGAQASGQLTRATGPDIAANTITGENIVAGTFTGEEFAGEVFVGNKFTSRSGGTGQGVEFGQDGYAVYRADNTLKFSVPISDEQNSFVDGEFIARGLTVTGGASFQSSQNEIVADAAMTLMRGIVAPSAIPQFGITWTTTAKTSTLSLSNAQKTGPLGTFDLDPASVSHIEYKPAGTPYWVLNHIRPNGTRSWFFTTGGLPYDLFGNGTYFNDQTDWERWSTTEITSGANAGVYTIFRFIPGAGTDWYVSGPVGINKYTRVNSSGTPALGNNGTNFFIAEKQGASDNRLRIDFHSMTPWSSGAIPTLPAASTTYISPSGQTAVAASPCYIQYSATGFDIAGSPPRFAIGERGVSYSGRTIRESSGVLLPGGTATAWTSSTSAAESFECPVSNRRGMGWDGANFWTYGSDGYLYKHEGVTTQFDPSVTSSKWWAQASFYDDLGTTHETKPGPIKSFTMYRRAKLLFTPPAIPDNGGVDDPKKVRLYMARGATQPANSAMWLQGAYTAPSFLTTLSTGTSNPLTAGTFPSTNPAVIKNDDSTLVISGDGSVLADQLATAKLLIGSAAAGGGHTIKQIRMGSFSGSSNATGNVTVTHGGATTPTYVYLTPEFAHQVRCNSKGTTTFNVVSYAFGSATPTNIAGLQFTWMAVWA